MANGPGVSGNGRSKPQRPNYQYPYLDPNSSHGRGGLSTVVPSPSYQDPGYSFDGIHSPVTWLDTSIFAGGQSKHNANAGYTSPISHSNNFPSGRNQNHRPHLTVCWDCLFLICGGNQLKLFPFIHTHTYNIICI